MKYSISLNTTALPKKLVIVQPDSVAIPADYHKIGTFDHGDNNSTDTPDGSHVIWHHVRDALYFTKSTAPAPGVAFWPENITDMQSVVITFKKPVGVAGVVLTPPTVSVAVAATTQLVAAVSPADAANKAVSYTSSDPAKATVSATGLVTGVAAGETTITVTTDDGAKTDTTVVTVTA